VTFGNWGLTFLWDLKSKDSSNYEDLGKLAGEFSVSQADEADTKEVTAHQNDFQNGWLDRRN
jgi:hypothetical protein